MTPGSLVCRRMHHNDRVYRTLAHGELVGRVDLNSVGFAVSCTEEWAYLVHPDVIGWVPIWNHEEWEKAP